LGQENDYFNHIFRILIKGPIRQPKKTLQNLLQSGKKAVSKFELSETQFLITIRDKIAYKTYLE